MKHKSIITDIVYDATAPNFPKDFFVNDLNFKGDLKFLSQEEYIDLICTGLAMLPEDMVVHRLTGDAPAKMLIAPLWTKKKFVVTNEIDKKLRKLNLYQGDYYEK